MSIPGELFNFKAFLNSSSILNTSNFSYGEGPKRSFFTYRLSFFYTFEAFKSNKVAAVSCSSFIKFALPPGRTSKLFIAYTKSSL